MRSIAVMNQKGGVGKTTTAVNLAAALAKSGRLVLLIDLDPQAHASLHLGIEPDAETKSVYDVLTDETPIADVIRRVSENLSLVPSHLDLAAAEMELAGVVGREFILRDKLAAISEKFDFLVVDCPPSLGVLTINALTSVSEIIIPLQPHFLALHGLSKLLQTVDLVVKRLNPALTLTGVVLCLYDGGTTLAREVASDVASFFTQSSETPAPKAWSNAKLFSTKIRRNIRLAEAPSYGQSIFDYDPKSNGAADYRQFADELIGETSVISTNSDNDSNSADTPLADESPATLGPGDLAMETD